MKTGPNADRKGVFYGGNLRKPGGSMSRFAGTSHHGNEAAATLRADHPAVVNWTTIFPKSVREAAPGVRLLIDGKNNAKTGDRITKGPWKGCKVFTFTLVERETCPSYCPTWRTCYGNSMPFAKRTRPTAHFEYDLREELVEKLLKHTKIAVRLHVLGDFFDLEYVMFWRRMLRDNPGLHVWGYTGRREDAGDDEDGEIVRQLKHMNIIFGGRCAIRFSGAQERHMATAVHWGQPEPGVTTLPEGRICPASLEKTAACGTCGLCWAQEMADTPIVFIGHGMNGGRKAKGKQGGTEG